MNKTTSPARLPALFLLVFLPILTALYVLLPTPPAPVPASAPLDQFSAERAFEHVKAIAQSPRPVGSAAHDAAREYILAQLTGLGLDPQVQDTLSVSTRGGRAARVQNIFARLEGQSEDGKAILLMGHYDSAASAPGASDDGSAVATLLETARALKASPQLQNDVIFLFPDGEELGLLGAKAFWDQHPWAAEVGLVLNFEARGHTGVVYTFETGFNNGWVMPEFVKAVPYPVASSLMGTVYHNMPNDTDFTIFRDAGLPGFNFGYISGAYAYHSPLDNIENLDLASLQHDGSYALSLTRHFGDLDLDRPSQPDAVYFGILWLGMIVYPGALAIPFAILAVLAVIGLIVFGLRRKRFSLKGIGLSFLTFLGIVAAAALAEWLVWQGVTLIHPQYKTMWLMALYNAPWYWWAFTALTIAIAAGLFALLRKKLSAGDLSVGAMLWWAILAALTSFTLPGVSYIFTWPLVFTLIGMAAAFAFENRPALKTAALGLTAIPAFALVAPTLLGVYNGLSMEMAVVPVILTALLSGLLFLHLDVIAALRHWLVPALSGLAALGCLIGGSLSAGFDANHPYPNAITYGLDAASGRAYWIGYDDPDTWTAQFLDGTSDKIQEFFPYSDRSYPKTAAPAATAEAAQITVLDDTLSGGGQRRLRLLVTAPPSAASVWVSIISDADPMGLWVSGEKMDDARYVEYWAPPAEGFEIILELDAAAGPVELVLVTSTPGLPEIPGFSFTPRPAEMMAAPSDLADVTLVSQRVLLP